VETIDRFKAHTAATLGERRRARAEFRVRELMAHRFVQHVENRVLAAGEFERLLDRIAARETDPYSVVDDDFGRALRDQLARPSGRASLDHVGIAVGDLQQALAFYRDALGLEVEVPEEVASQRVRAHFIPAGESSIELLEATAKDSAIAKYVEKRGPGIHHITLRVRDIRAVLDQLRGRGVRLVDQEPRAGAEGSLVAFIHPSAAHGVL